MKLFLEIELLSDASFGRGDGLSNVVDAEIEHDPSTGCPFIKGRSIKGLLVEECANLLFSIEKISKKEGEKYSRVAAKLFGVPGSSAEGDGTISFSDACLPALLRVEIADAIAQNHITAQQVLESLTDVRSLTSINYETGAPQNNSLRSIRVLLHSVPLTSTIYTAGDLEDTEKSLLSACVMSLRRGGSGRNRGRGKLNCRLMENDDKELTTQYFDPLKMILSTGG